MTGYIESPPKRRKLNHDQDHPRVHLVPVTHADQLHQWTEFSTDSSAKSRITAFKDHLASIARLEDVAQQSKQFRILKEYCEWQKAPSDDQVHFNDLLSTWSYAVDNNADAVISAVPGALAQLLKTISGTFELQPFGLALIDSLLRRDQSKLFEKCLSAPRSRPHLASPCLRLLTEIVSFGVGARAGEFWTRRDLVMYKFEPVLEQHNTDKGLEERRKPSVRRMALRLLLAMLKHLDAHAKADLLVQGRTLHACLNGLPLDGDDIVVEVLRSIESSLVDDEEVPRECIILFFKSSRLDLLASLYKFEAEDDTSETRDSVREALQRLLEKLCTTRKGIVIPDHGWHPFGSAVGYVPTSEDDYIDLGLDSSYYDEARKAPVTNVELLAFISKLRHGDPLQSSLLLHALRAAPELVAEYFSRPQTHRMTPPDSEDETWRAHFAFLFSVIESEVPSSLAMAKEPPQPRFAIESIVPKPIDRGYVNKLLSSKDEILKVSGARLLTVVLKKLSKVLDAFARHSSASDQSYIWQQAKSKLSELVESRTTTARDISLAIQHTTRDEPSYSALLECLHRYYKALPHMAATNTFDIGPILLEVCSSLETTDLKDGAAALLEQLSHCVEIANMASSTKWLHKPDNETLSPLGRVLKVAMAQATEDEAKDVLRVVRQVLTGRGILVPGDSAFAALCSSLSKHKKFSPSEELYLFLDNCIARTNQKPVKYLDDLEHASQLVSDKKPISLITGAIAEQWAFTCKRYKDNKSVLKNIATWITRLFALLDSAGENYRIVTHLQENMLSGSTGKSKEYLQEALDKLRKKPAVIEEQWLLRKQHTVKDAEQDVDMEDAGAPSLDAIDQLLVKNIPIPDSLEGLDKWPADFDIELEVDTNRLRRLLLCVSSPDEEIRLQTQQILQQITYTVDTTSTHTLKHQVYLVLGEVCETLIQQGTSQPQPTIIPELADTLIRIMLHPTHILYAKANKFLLHKPSWPAKHTALYWLQNILHREPDDPDARTLELEWLLQLFLHSLLTPIDLDLYRRTGLWETLLSLYSSPVLTQPNKQLILALLRAACSISGGVDMLWTRFGVHSWLRMKEATDKENEGVLNGLREDMERECSRVIEGWEVACSLTKKAAPARQ